MSRTTSRRQFLRHAVAMGAAGAGVGFFRRAAGGELAPQGNQEAVKSRPDVIVARGGYPGWPWIARTGPERLVCVFRDDSIHGFSPTGRAMIADSSDNGKTWAPARLIVDEPGVDDRNVAVAPLPDGTLLVCYNTYTRQLVSRPMVIASKDGGATWGKPRLMADLDARTRGAPVPLSSGEILIPIYKAPGSGSLAAISRDGKSWQLAVVPDTAGFLGDEWAVVEVQKGRLVGIIRNSGARDGYFWKTESRDAGRTWSVPARTNVRDARSTSPADLDLHGKTPVLTYADRRMISVSMVTTRDPEFLTWDLDHRLPCYQYRPDGKPIADASYPVSVAVGPHRRLIVDYEIRAEGKWIAGYFVDLPKEWE